jgi:hypothetical protein
MDGNDARFIEICKKQKLPILNSILVVFKTGAFSVCKVSILYNYRVIQYPGGFPSIQDLRMSLLGDRLHDRPGFSSFLVTFFFSFHKEKKKVTKRFEMKEELELKEI